MDSNKLKKIYMKNLSVILLLIMLVSCNAQNVNELSLAEKPPMGWNSYNSYGIFLYEEAAFNNLEVLSESYKQHGYEYFVIDGGWFQEWILEKGTKFPLDNDTASINMDEYGLVQPSNTYFPNGFKKLIERCHELDLKFGLHLYRGIPRKAVKLNTKVKGTSYRAKDVADTINNISTWFPLNFGLNMEKPGAQEYYNGLINQLAEWGVDFIKYDDLVPYPAEIKAINKAIKQCGRPIVLSLSPGNVAPLENLETYKLANSLRVTSDVWDTQSSNDKAFKAWKKWEGTGQKGFWIDMDMLVFGQLQLMSPKREKFIESVPVSGRGYTRWCELDSNQMRTFITIRSLCASPLMIGGDLITMDEFSYSLMTNSEIISCNQNSVMGSFIKAFNGIEIWEANQKNTNNKWVGIFNRTDTIKNVNLLKELNIENDPKIFDIWSNNQNNNYNDVSINPYDVLFLKLSN